MATGFFTAACICLMLGQAASDVFHTNQRNHRIPVNIQESRRADIRELILYSSIDQGRTWSQAVAITPEKEFFAYYAPGDGNFWFRVALVDKTGKQEPDDRNLKNGPPDLNMAIDTVNPIIKAFQAQRVGDEVFISWDVQEEHPDLSREGLRLEYQVKDSLVETWKPIAGPTSLKGQTSFNPGHKQPLVIRLTARDLAKNQSFGMSEVAGTVTAASFTNPPSQSPLENQSPLSLPGGITIPKQPVEEPKTPMFPSAPQLEPRPGVPNPGGVVMPPPVKEAPMDKVVADSRTPPQPDVVKPAVRDPQIPGPGGIQTPKQEGSPDVKSLVNSSPARKPLPLLQYVNQHLIKLQYEIKRQGPSGIGGVQIWLTKDDGETWSPYAEVKDLNNEAVQGKQDREFEFRDKQDAPFPDGIYGLILVVKNRAGLGREPRPGDVPEIRVEIDSKPPVAQLFQPVPDPANPSQLLLKWSAQDKNLTDAPINLEYSEKREGPWQPIELNQKNAGRYTNQLVTGDYSWKVPPSTPVQVFLRLRVRDKAGNESVAVTADPQFVDLVEPEGALIGILPQTKR